jgi:hypothetical protein
MHFLFRLLRIKDLYMFRALLAHPQEVPHKSTWYIACVLCQLAAPTDTTRKQYTKCHCEAPPGDEQVMLETCKKPLILNELHKKCITLVSLF